MSQKITLHNVRLSFPDLFTAVEFKTGDGKPRFNASFLVEKGSENDLAVRSAIKAEAAEAYGKKAEAMLKSIEGQTNKYCYTDGSLKEYEGYEGMMVLAAHAKVRPLVIDRDKTPLTAADGRPYSGCCVNAIVEIYGQTGEKAGMRCGFSGVQFFADGDAFSGGRPANIDEFEDLGAGAEADAFV